MHLGTMDLYFVCFIFERRNWVLIIIDSGRLGLVLVVLGPNNKGFIQPAGGRQPQKASR